jgi:hypothetical protein
MKTMRVLAVFFAGTLMLAHTGWAQEKAKRVDELKPLTPLKVQVVFSEIDGDRKISSLPYTLFVIADDPGPRVQTILRMGLRVPVTVTTKDSPAAIQYLDVGTNIDCSAGSVEDARFKVDLSVERSSLYSTSPEKKSLDWSPGDPSLSTQPIIRQFRASLKLLMRDGQTVQSTVATDPVIGRVLKVDVTLSVVK